MSNRLEAMPDHCPRSCDSGMDTRLTCRTFLPVPLHKRESRMDNIDKNILHALQTDASRSQREIAEKVALSQNACWSRIRKLKETGVIERFTIDVDPRSAGIGIIVLVLIKTRHHSEDWIAQFTRKLEAEDEVVEFFRIAGDFRLRAESHDARYREL